MTIQLTPEQWSALQAGSGGPVQVVTPGDPARFVLLPAETYERLRALFEDVPVTPDERTAQLREFGRRAGWDDPEMDVYDDLDPRRL